MWICSRSSTLPARCGLVWLGTGLALAGLVRLAVPAATAAARGPAEFSDLLVAGCAATAVLAGARLWWLATLVALDVARRRPPARRAVGPLAALVLAACGVAVLGAAPAGATPRPVSPLDGLPLPDRAVGAVVLTHGADELHVLDARPTTVRVRPGDSLWSIAERRLGPGATAARVAAYWPRIHAANAAVIGDDPDLIQPDQRLVLPPTDEESSWKR